MEFITINQQLYPNYAKPLDDRYEVEGDITQARRAFVGQIRFVKDKHDLIMVTNASNIGRLVDYVHILTPKFDISEAQKGNEVQLNNFLWEMPNCLFYDSVKGYKWNYNKVGNNDFIISEPYARENGSYVMSKIPVELDNNILSINGARQVVIPLYQDVFPSSPKLPMPIISGTETLVKHIYSLYTPPTTGVTYDNGCFDKEGRTLPTLQPTIPPEIWDSEAIISSGITGFTNEKVELGKNTIRYTVKRDFISPSDLALFPVSKLGEAYYGTEATWEHGTAETSRDTVITGVYPVYTNIVGNSLSSSANTMCAAEDTKTFYISYPKEDDNNKVQFLFPAGRSVTAQVYNDISGKYENYTGGYDDTNEIEKIIDGHPIKFILWKRVSQWSNDAMKYCFILSKKTSE